VGLRNMKWYRKNKIGTGKIKVAPVIFKRDRENENWEVGLYGMVYIQILPKRYFHHCQIYEKKT